MTTIRFNELSEKQRSAWTMRYRYGWCLRRIALALGVQKHTVSELLQRAHRRVGMPRRRHLRIVRAKPRLAPTQSLGIVYEL